VAGHLTAGTRITRRKGPHPMGSKPFKLDSNDWKRIGMTFLIALAGAIITFLQGIENIADWGVWSALVGALATAAVSFLRNWIRNNSDDQQPPRPVGFGWIIAASLVMTNAAVAGDWMLLPVSRTADAAVSVKSKSCDCDDCRCSEDFGECECSGSHVAMYSVNDSTGNTDSTDDSGSLRYRNRQILMFTTDWCVVCKQWELKQKPRMEQSGWTFGSQSDLQCIVRSIDGDERPDLVRNYRVTSYPTFLCLEDNLVVARFDRSVTPEELCDVYGRDSEDAGSEESRTAGAGEATGDGPRRQPDGQLQSGLAGNDQREGRSAARVRPVAVHYAPGATAGGDDAKLRQQGAHRQVNSQAAISGSVCDPQGCSQGAGAVRVYSTRPQVPRNRISGSRLLFWTSGCRTCRSN